MKSLRIYRFDTLNLSFKKVSTFFIIGIVLLLFILGVLFGSHFWKINSSPHLVEPSELIIILDEAENESVTPKKIYEFLVETRVKYPEIVWSQCAIETGFKSSICRENNNFFGMKKSTIRPHVQNGENRGHAVYRNWKLSVIDYAIWQSSVGLLKIKSEEKYFEYLGQSYAEDPEYVVKVKKIRENFNHYLEKYNQDYLETR